MEPVHFRTALVTGAASGFGFEFSKLLARDSYHLILVDQDGDGLNDVKKILYNDFNAEAEIICCELSGCKAADKIFTKTREQQVEILINNAGYGLYGPFITTDWKVEEKMINLHILTITHLTKKFAADMVARRHGMIMNISSVAAFQPGPLMAVYYATKSYILSFTAALANELKGSGVKVTAFCPGQTRTKFQENVARLSQSIPSHAPLITDPEKVAKQGYLAMKEGKTMMVPGFTNKLIVFLNRFITRRMASTLVRHLQENIRKIPAYLCWCPFPAIIIDNSQLLYYLQDFY